jgi:hypothetical protein
MGLGDLINRLEHGDEAQGLVVRRLKPAEATVGEIREACDAHPDHPIAVIFRQATHGMPPTQSLVVDHNDLLALATNRDVVNRSTVRDGAMVVLKEIGERRGAPPATPGPAEITQMVDEPGMQTMPEDDGHSYESSESDESSES